MIHVKPRIEEFDPGWLLVAERSPGGTSNLMAVIMDDHSPCHLCRDLEVTREPGRIPEIAGLDCVPAKDEDVCCGFGGSYCVTFPEISAELLQRKPINVEATGAEMLVTECPGCVLQVRGGMDKTDSKMTAKHIAQVLA